MYGEAAQAARRCTPKYAPQQLELLRLFGSSLKRYSPPTTTSRRLGQMLSFIFRNRASRRLAARRHMLAVALGSLLWSSMARAEVFYTVRDLLAEQFKGSGSVSFVKLRLAEGPRKQIEARLGYRLAKSEYVLYVARSGTHVDGFALFDEERGQHELISIATFFNPTGAVTRVEIVAYREPFGDGVRAERFRRQFVGRSAGSGFALHRDIDAISGATISSASLCRGVRRASELVREWLSRPRELRAAGSSEFSTLANKP